MKKTSKYNIREDIIPITFHEQSEGNLFHNFQITTFTAQRTAQNATFPFPLFEILGVEFTSRTIEKGKTPSFETCRFLSALAATCHNMYRIINYNLLQCTESCLQNKLSQNIFSDLEISFTEIQKEFIVGDDSDPEHLYENPIYYTNYILLLFLSAKYSGSPICQQFQDVFDKWNFDVGSLRDNEYNKWNTITQFHINLVEQLIKLGFTLNPNHQLCVIKKIVFGCLNTPQSMLAIGFGTEELFKKLLKNTTPWKGYECKYTDSNNEVHIGQREFDRFVEEIRPINTESIDWMINELCNVLAGNGYEKAKKSLELLCLLSEHDFLTPNVEYCRSILAKTKKWIEIEADAGEFSHSLSWFLRELIQKGIKKEFLSFLHPDFILDVRESETILKALAQHEILQKDSEFKTIFMNKIIIKLSDTNPDNWMLALEHIMILSDNKILVNYPNHHEAICDQTIDWLLHEKLPIRPILLIESLVKNDTFICSARDIMKIAKCSILYLRSGDFMDRKQCYIAMTLIILNKLLVNKSLFSEHQSFSSSFYRSLNELLEIIKTNYISNFRVTKESTILFPEVLLKLQKLKQEVPPQPAVVPQKEVSLEQEVYAGEIITFEVLTSPSAILVYLLLIAHLYTTFYN